MIKSFIRIKKLLSLLIIFLLILTIFSQTVVSKDFFSKIKDKTIEKIDEIKDNTKKFLDNSNNRINFRNKDGNFNQNIIKRINGENLYNSLLSYSLLKTQSGLFNIFAKYADHEIESSLKLGLPNLIDINNDGKNDIKTSLILRLGIEKPFAISLNFRLKVDRLDGITDSDEHLEVYIQLRFPGFLDDSLKGNKVHFGILSEKYEEIPNSCEITYKYIPNIFSKDKPIHTTILDPGNIKGNDELNILFSYINIDGIETKCADNFNIKLEPAVKTEMTLTGFENSVGRSFNLDTTSHTTAVVKYSRSSNGNTFNAGLIIYRLSSFNFDVELTPFKLGGGRIEYTRQSDKPVQVLLFFKNTDNNNYFFAEEIPSHIKVSWSTADNNLIKVDTFGDRCSSVGWRNALLDEDVTTMAYISNLPSYIELNWIGKLADGEIELRTDVGGCSTHVYASELGNDGFISADIHSSENFDFSVYWDFSRQVFGISRSNLDLYFDVSFYNLLRFGESANISFEIENEITSPFEFCLDELLDFDAKIEFTGNDFEIKNVDVDLNIPSIGRFILKANSFKMTRQSSVYFAFSVDETEEEINVECDIHVSNGVKITGLVVGFNDFLLPIDDIDISGEYHNSVSLSITQGFVDHHFNEDGSGYIIVSGGISLFVDSDFYDDYGNLIGHLECTIAFINEDESLNISWDPNFAFTIDGRGVLSLSGFNLWIKDKFEITISSIVGGFTLNSEDNSGSLNLVLSKSVVTLVSDFDIDFEDFEGITFRADFSIDGSIVLSGNLKISWGTGGVQISTVGIGVGVIGDFSVSDLYFKMGDMFEISSDIVALSGSLALDFSLDVGSGSFGVSLGSSGTSISVKSFDINYPGVIVASFTEFYLGGSGFITVGSSSSYKVLVANVAGRVTVMGLYIGSNSLGLPSPLQLSFSTDLSAAGQIEYVVGDGYEEIIVSIWGSTPIRVDNFYFNLNSGQILASWNKLHIGLSAFGKIRMGANNIYFDASLSYVIFDGFELIVQGDKLNINGEVDCLYSGTIDLKVDSYTTPYPEIEIDLNDGLLEINDFYFKYAENNGKYIETEWSSISIAAALDLDILLKNNDIIIDADGSGDVDFTSFSVSSSNGISASFDSLNIDADFILNLVYNTASEEFNVEASGNGQVEISTASLSMSDTVGVSLGYFKLDLDDIKGSAIDLSIGENLNIESASASGSISSIIIENTSINVDIGLLIIEKADVDFHGKGELNIDWFENDPTEANINLVITDPDSQIDVKYLYVKIEGYFELEVNTFQLRDKTSLELMITADILENVAEPEINMMVNVGSDDWYINQFDFSIALGGTFAHLLTIKELSGKGTLSLGVHNWEDVGYYDFPLPEDLIIELNGEWDWNHFILDLRDMIGNSWAIVDTEIGSFNGHMNFYLDFINFWFGNILTMYVGGEVFQETNWDFFKFFGEDGYLSFLSVNLKPGNFLFDWNMSSICSFEINNSGTVNPKFHIRWVKYSKNIDFSVASARLSVPYFMIKWDLEQEINNKKYIFLDTNNQECTLSIDFLNFIKLFEGSFKAEDLLIEWDADNNDDGYCEITNGNGEFSSPLRLIDKWSLSGYLSPLVRFDWNIDGDGTGYLKADTDNEWCEITLIYNNLIRFTGRFRADEKEISWDLNAGPGNYFDISGSWEFDPSIGFGIQVYHAGSWTDIVGNADFNELSVDLSPQDPFTEGDNFQVHVTDSNSNNDISGATVTYKKKTGLLYSVVETLTTDSNGYTSDFNAEVYDGSSTDCKIIVAHPDYDSITIYFTVIPQGETGEAYISGQVLDVSEFWDPLPGATISCSEDSDVSDSNGDYLLTVSPGVHTVTATYPDYETKTTTITVNDGQTSTYIFNMMPENMGSLIGWVKIAGTNTGVADATVTASPGGETVQTLMYGAQKGRFDMYLEPGQYDLTITKDGYEDSHVYDVNIYDDQETNVGDIEITPINEPPVAVLTITPTSAKVGEIVTFDFSDSSDPDGDALEYRLRWDSDTEPGNNEWSTYWFTDTSKTHIYNTPGTKKAWLQVKDSKEATDITSVTIVISSVNWVSPDSDEYNLWWSDRDNAYDGDESSSSYYGKPLDSYWSDSALVLKYNNPVDCDGFRIKAKNYDHLEKMKIVLYSSSNQKYSKEFSSWEYYIFWTYHETSDLTDIDRVEISFKLEDGYKFGSHYAHVYEFDLREI